MLYKELLDLKLIDFFRLSFLRVARSSSSVSFRVSSSSVVSLPCHAAHFFLEENWRPKSL